MSARCEDYSRTSDVYAAFRRAGWELLPGWQVDEISLNGRPRWRVTESPALAGRLGVPVHQDIDEDGQRLGPVVMAGGRFWAGDGRSIEQAEKIMLAAETRHDNEFEEAA
jgi:hypothetical protein